MTETAEVSQDKESQDRHKVMIKPHVLAVTLKVNILNSLIKSTQCGRKDKVQIKESLQTQGHRQTEIENCIP